MPQLVKGGKYVFGWAGLKKDGLIRMPDKAFEEYKFEMTEKIILMSGSKASGGFSINRLHGILGSKIGQQIIDSIGYLRESRSFKTQRSEIIEVGDRLICWTILDEKKIICLSNELIDSLGLKIGSKLLVVRGSGPGPAFIARGPIYEEALKHDDLPAY